MPVSSGLAIDVSCTPEHFQILSAPRKTQRIRYHRAEVVKETPGKVPDTSNVEFQMTAKCLECSGSGKLMEGERCRFCNGAGTVQIVVRK